MRTSIEFRERQYKKSFDRALPLNDAQKNIPYSPRTTTSRHIANRGEARFSSATPIRINEHEPICPSVDFLLDYGISAKTLKRAHSIALENDTTAAQELITFCGIKEETYYRLVADYVGVRFVELNALNDIVLPIDKSVEAAHFLPMIWAKIDTAKPTAILAPSPRHLSTLKRLLRKPKQNADFFITAPSILREAIIRKTDQQLADRATSQLAIDAPSWSARYSAHGWQGATAALFFLGALVAFFAQPSMASLTVHLVLSLFFLMCVAVRVLAIVNYRKPKRQAIDRFSDAEKPVYSVLVPLYDEAAVVPDLIQALKKIKWPRSKLELKIVCEADDEKTLQALAAQDLDSRFEIIRVPKLGPNTKPKALCYALNFTAGSFVTVYDAEDRPHPEQLLEAYAKFRNSDENLGCVQAPLIAANPSRSLWTTMFHFEYAGLFNGLLPWLARRGAPIMLGGTSNHFKRDTLLQTGAWDPFNVTEDADLGLRIWRCGFETDMITRPTLEDAPRDFKTWLPQRTRWFKGWMQTWIVHMRRPKELWSNMSKPAFVITQLMLTGTIASALLHPIFLYKAIALTVVPMLSGGSLAFSALAVLDWSVVLISYMAFMTMCWQSTDAQTRRNLKLRLLLTPFYWIAISVAAWRGLYHFLDKPFEWEKTPHLPYEKVY